GSEPAVLQEDHREAPWLGAGGRCAARTAGIGAARATGDHAGQTTVRVDQLGAWLTPHGHAAPHRFVRGGQVLPAAARLSATVKSDAIWMAAIRTPVGAPGLVPWAGGAGDPAAVPLDHRELGAQPGLRPRRI